MELFNVAVENGELAEVTRILRDVKTDGVDPTELSGPIFSSALNDGFKAIALALMRDSRFDPNFGNGESLIQSISLGYLDIAAELLDLGANPNLRSGQEKARCCSHWRMSTTTWRR